LGSVNVFLLPPCLYQPSKLYISPLKQNKKSESTFISIAPRIMKERCVLEGFQASPVCPCGKSEEDEYGALEG